MMRNWKSKTWLKALGLAAVMFVGATPAIEAQAAPMSKFKVGSWRGGAYSSNKTGAFSHCAASASYKSGILLVFSVDRKYRWSMGFAKDSWNLTKGRRYPVTYRVDRFPIVKGSARATSSRLVTVLLPGKVRLFNQMRRGNLLYVKTAKEVLRFKLSGSSKMLARLLRCVKKRERSSDPFADDRGNDDPFDDASDPFGPGTDNARPAPRRPRSQPAKKPRRPGWDA